MAREEDDGFQQLLRRFEEHFLDVAQYIRDKDLICNFLPNSSTRSVHPHLWILTAMEEFITDGRLDKTEEVVGMLEFLRHHYPDVGDGKTYVNLLVDLKTKALSYDLFAKGALLSDQQKESIVDKYFNPELCDTDDLPTDPNLTDEQYYAAMHCLARSGVEEMLSSSQQVDHFKTSILDPVECPRIHKHLIEQLTSYLSKIRQHLPVPLLLKSFALINSRRAEDKDQSNRASQSSSLSPTVIQDTPEYMRLLYPTKDRKRKLKKSLVSVKVTPFKKANFSSIFSSASDPGTDGTTSCEDKNEVVKRENTVKKYPLRYIAKGQQRYFKSPSSSSSNDSDDAELPSANSPLSTVRRSSRHRSRNRVNYNEESLTFTSEQSLLRDVDKDADGERERAVTKEDRLNSEHGTSSTTEYDSNGKPHVSKSAALVTSPRMRRVNMSTKLKFRESSQSESASDECDQPRSFPETTKIRRLPSIRIPPLSTHKRRICDSSHSESSDDMEGVELTVCDRSRRKRAVTRDVKIEQNINSSSTESDTELLPRDTKGRRSPRLKRRKINNRSKSSASSHSESSDNGESHKDRDDGKPGSSALHLSRFASGTSQSDSDAILPATEVRRSARLQVSSVTDASDNTRVMSPRRGQSGPQTRSMSESTTQLEQVDGMLQEAHQSDSDAMLPATEVRRSARLQVSSVTDASDNTRVMSSHKGQSGPQTRSIGESTTQLAQVDGMLQEAHQSDSDATLSATESDAMLSATESDARPSKNRVNWKKKFAVEIRRSPRLNLKQALAMSTAISENKNRKSTAPTFDGKKKNTVAAASLSHSVHSPSESGLSSSVPTAFKRPKRKLSFDGADGECDSDTSDDLRRVVKKVRFADDAESELSDLDFLLVSTADQARDRKKGLSETANVSSSISNVSTDDVFQLASEVTVSSDSMDPHRGTYRYELRGERSQKTTTTPSTELSVSTEGDVMLPSAELLSHGQVVVEPLTSRQEGVSSGLLTVLDHVCRPTAKKRTLNRNKTAKKKGRLQAVPKNSGKHSNNQKVDMTKVKSSTPLVKTADRSQENVSQHTTVEQDDEANKQNRKYADASEVAGADRITAKRNTARKRTVPRSKVKAKPSNVHTPDKGVPKSPIESASSSLICEHHNAGKQDDHAISKAKESLLKAVLGPRSVDKGRSPLGRKRNTPATPSSDKSKRAEIDFLSPEVRSQSSETMESDVENPLKLCHEKEVPSLSNAVVNQNCNLITTKKNTARKRTHPRSKVKVGSNNKNSSDRSPDKRVIESPKTQHETSSSFLVCHESLSNMDQSDEMSVLNNERTQLNQVEQGVETSMVNGERTQSSQVASPISDVPDHPNVFLGQGRPSTPITTSTDRSEDVEMDVVLPSPELRSQNSEALVENPLTPSRGKEESPLINATKASGTKRRRRRPTKNNGGSTPDKRVKKSQMETAGSSPIRPEHVCHTAVEQSGSALTKGKDSPLTTVQSSSLVDQTRSLAGQESLSNDPVVERVDVTNAQLRSEQDNTAFSREDQQTLNEQPCQSSQHSEQQSSYNELDKNLFETLKDYQRQQESLKKSTAAIQPKKYVINASGFAFHSIQKYQKATCYMCSRVFTSSFGFQKHVKKCRPKDRPYVIVPVELANESDNMIVTCPKPGDRSPAQSSKSKDVGISEGDCHAQKVRSPSHNAKPKNVSVNEGSGKQKLPSQSHSAKPMEGSKDGRSQAVRSPTKPNNRYDGIGCRTQEVCTQSHSGKPLEGSKDCRTQDVRSATKPKRYYGGISCRTQKVRTQPLSTKPKEWFETVTEAVVKLEPPDSPPASFDIEQIIQSHNHDSWNGASESHSRSRNNKSRKKATPSAHTVAQAMLNRTGILHHPPPNIQYINHQNISNSNHVATGALRRNSSESTGATWSSVVSPDIDVVGFTPEYVEPQQQDADAVCYMSPEIGMMNSLNVSVSPGSSQHSRFYAVSNQPQGLPRPQELQHERYYLYDDEYEQSQTLSQYNHAPVQTVARQFYSPDVAASELMRSSALNMAYRYY